MATDHTVLFTADTIAEKVNDLAARIDRDHGEDGVVVIVVLKGAAIFAADLVRAMETETELAYLTASSYVDGFTPGESLSLRGDLDLDVGGRSCRLAESFLMSPSSGTRELDAGWAVRFGQDPEVRHPRRLPRLQRNATTMTPLTASHTAGPIA